MEYEQNEPEISRINYSDLLFTTAGVGLALSLTVYSKKPKLYHLPKVLLGGLIGYGCGRWYVNFRIGTQRNRLKLMEDYMRLHPDDFVESIPQKYKDVVLPWYPIR